jgi:DNA-binding NtrC family response regulator
LIQEAEGGTLFLDEIDCLPPRAQVKLLRFIQEKEYKQLGSSKVRRADVRLIAASNTDLGQQIRQGRFRQDLYYRLNVIPLALPPLRRREQDISLLARHFLEKYALEHRKGFRDLSPEAHRKLAAHDWPGNVRELENIIQRAVILSKTVTLRDTDIDLPSPAPANGKVMSFQEAKGRFIRTYIADLLQNHQGNITRAAQSANKNRRAFWELMRKYGVSADNYKFQQH